jgi:O-antigen/teichoic acid export membrane protein
MALSMVSGSINARVLGPVGRGEVAAIQTIPSALGMVALMGLPSAVGFFTARRPTEVRAFTKTGVLLFLLAAAPLIAVGYVILPTALAHQRGAVIANARLYLLFVLLHLSYFPHMALQGLGRFGTWNLLRPLQSLAGLGAVALVAIAPNPEAGTYTRWLLLLQAIGLPITYLVLWASSSPGQASVSGARARELLRYGLPSALMIPAGLLNLQLDQMLMAAWLPSDRLGLYAIGTSWSNLMSPVFGALGSVVFPKLAAVRDREGQGALIGRSFRLAVLVVAILAIGLAGLTPFMLPMLFGHSFAAAVPAALVLVVAVAVLNLGNLGGEVLRGIGAPRWPLFSQLAALPVTIVLLCVLLPRWSVLGAAVSSLAAYAVALAVLMYGIRRLSGLTPRDLLMPRREDIATLLSLGRGVISRRVR